MDHVVAAQNSLRLLADEHRAAEMARYLRGQFPFLGIPTPARTAALKVAWRDLPPLDEHGLGVAVRELWAMGEREFQYAACDLLERHLGTARKAASISPGFLTGTVVDLITSKSWWDSVDSLRAAAVGPLVLAHRAELAPVVARWIDSDDRWLVRSAIIHQLGYKDATDEDLLFALCARRADDREFFVGKAIGWALRQHAYRRPDAVRAFVAAHPELTPLARREALKRVGG